MRSAALTIALAVIGCKEPQPAPQQQAAPSSGASATKAAPPRPSFDRPKVSGPSVVKITKVSATVTYGQKELLLDGGSLGTFQNGMAPAEMLERLARALETAGASGDPIGISLDPKLPYVRVSQLLAALRTAGLRNLALLTGNGTTAVPLEMIDADQVGASGVRPVVTIRGGRMFLWSMSGEEGTQSDPKLTGTPQSLGPLTKALGEIVQRRWPDGMRAAEDRIIVIQMAGNETAEKLLLLLAAVRMDGNLELFPTVFLAGGA